MPQNLGADHPLKTPSTTQTLSSSAGPVNISFSFINDADVLVFLGGTLRTNGTGSDNYTINTAKTQVTFNNTVSGEVIITRKSDLLSKVRTFTAGSSVRAADLNTQFDQVMQLIQDNYELLRGVIQNDANSELTVGRTLLIKDDAVVTNSVADGSITTPKLAADAVDGTKIADDSINSEHYIDLSIDRVHLSNDIIDSTKLADDSVDSEHYVDLSIDAQHLATNSVTTDKIADAELTELATMANGTASALADLTQAEVQILDDCVVTTTELNNSLDGCEATAAELNLLHDATVTTDEINILDGVTADKDEINTLTGVNSTLTAADLNQLDNNTLTTSATWTSDTQFPSAKNIDDRITARIDPIGGYEAIADEDSFPAAADGVPEGTIISIANVGGMVVPAASGSPAVATTTDASRAGGSDTVTIQNIPATAAGQTLQDGLGMLVVATGTAHTYDFHRVVATDQDVIGLSRQMDDFAARYRVGNTNPTTGLCGLDGTGTGNRPCDGDMFFNTGTGKMLVYDGDSGTANTDAAVQARWEEVQSIGNFKIIPATELADFASGSASVETITDAPTSAEQIVLSINGVIQEPNSGTSAPTDGFALDGDIIRLSATPPASSEVWGVIIGSAVNIGTPSNNTVNAAILQTDAVTTVKILNSNVTTAKLADDSVTSTKLADSTDTDANRAVTRNHIRNDAIDGTKIADDAVDSEHIANGAVDLAHMSANSVDSDQYVDGSIDTAHIADNQITTAKLGANSVTRAEILDGEVTHVKIANDAVDGDNIAADVALTGNPTATTQTAGNNTTRIATTAFVQTALGGISSDSISEGDTTVETVDTGSDGHITFDTDGSERMRIISNGRVGIGTTQPSCELEISGTGAVEIPQGTDLQRPTAAAGMLRYNTDDSALEISDGTSWMQVSVVRTARVLIVGGGAGNGGSWPSGGGGGGQAQELAAFNLDSGTAYRCSIGAGGNTNSGNDTQFNNTISGGGGRGGTFSGGAGTAGNAQGGSGGGGSGASSGTTAGGAAGGTNQANSFAGGQGNNGAGNGSAVAGGGAGGGGGGAGGIGGWAGRAWATDPSTGTLSRGAGSGAPGFSTTITGSAEVFGGGGCGGAGDGSLAGSIQSGATAQQSNGAANGGAGAGGNSGQSTFNGTGGSGVIIIRVAQGITATFTSGCTVNGTSNPGSNVSGTNIAGTSDQFYRITAGGASDTVTFNF